jgi:hypothetical protein
MVWHNSWSGTWRQGAVAASVNLGVARELQFQAPVPGELSSQQALRISHLLPFCLRIARSGPRLVTIGEFPIDPAATLHERLRWVGEAWSRIACDWPTLVSGQLPLPPHGTPCDRKRERDAAGGQTSAEVTTEQLIEQLAAHAWPTDAVVESADGWEIRPVTNLGSAESIPVRVRRQADGLWLSISLLASPPAGRAFHPSLVDQAVRFNAQSRHARLALTDAALLAESWISDCCWRNGGLPAGVRAVAAVAAATRTVLEILDQQADTANGYAAIFGLHASGTNGS